MRDTIGEMLDRAVRQFRQDVAVIDGERRISYGELGARVNQVARALVDLGNEPGTPGRAGDRVGMLVPNCAEFLFASYGIWKAGLAWTQLQPLGGPESWAYVLNDARVRTLVYHPMFAEAVERTRPSLETVERFVTVGPTGGGDPDLLELAGREDESSPDFGVTGDTPFMVGYSSGTTGTPKGIVWSHRAWVKGLLSFMIELPELSGGRFLHVAPLTHMTSLFVLPTWIRGGANVILPWFEPLEWLATVEREKITGTAAVPTILYVLLDYEETRKADLSSLRLILYGGSPMATERLAEALEVFGPILVQGYACSEGGLVSVLPKQDHRTDEIGRRRLASAGRPATMVEVRIVDPASGEEKPTGEPGEIAIWSEHHMAGYWDASRNAETLRDDGFVLTGDIGQLDQDGYLYLVDRKKDIIVSGGFNVFPRDVEEVIHEHPAVRNVAVIGVPDPKWGEAVHACVVLEPGAEATPEEIRVFVSDRKGKLYAPRSVEFVAHIPTTPQGKPDKKVLRGPHWEGRERAVN